MKAKSLLNRFERKLRADSIRPRVSEHMDKDRIGQICNQALENMKPSVIQLYGRDIPDIAVGGLKIWDFTALVTKNKWNTAFAIGVSIGAVRLFDLTNTCRWALGSYDYPETLRKDDTSVFKVWGSILYQYVTQRYHDLRHWMLDITMGTVVPYALNPVIASYVHEKLRSRQELALNVVISFIVAHEVSHIMSGHLSNKKSNRVISLSGSPSTIVSSDINWEHEFTADVMAVKILFLASDSLKFELLRQVSFFFNILETMERISTERIFWGHSHPSPNERLLNIIENLPLDSMSSHDAEKLYEAAQTFSYIPDELGEWIVDSPGEFRNVAQAVIEDYEEEVPDALEINQSASLNNLGDEFRAKGNYKSALAYYEQAIAILRGLSYGEGYRIVYRNLIYTSLLLGESNQAIKWLIEAINSAFDHRDRPAAIWLMKDFHEHIKNMHPRFSNNDLTILSSLKKKADLRLTALIDAILRLT